jgi:flagellar biosynthetic protein FliR
MNLSIDPAWAVGLILALIRTGGFVAASPLTSRMFPTAGRLALTLGIGWALAGQVAPPNDLKELAVMSATNLGVGITLGLLTGLVLHIFEMAGGLIDLFAGLQTGAILDPITGVASTIFSKAFNLTAGALFLTLGGLHLAVRGLAGSVAAVALDGGIALDDSLAKGLMHMVGSMVAASLELALPAVAALFLAEIVLGLAARLAPQANMFLLGLPVKLGTALITVSLVVATFPSTVTSALSAMEDAFVSTIHALAG